MKATKGLVLVLALVMLVTAFAGCASPTAEEPVKVVEEKMEEKAEEMVEEAPLRIAFITKVMNPYFKVMVEGAQAAADEYGVEMLHSAAQEQTAVEQQIAIVQDMIAKQVDAICIAPIGSKELVPVLAEAIDAGIPVINVDNKLDDAAMGQLGISITYVGVDDEVSAYNAGKAIVDALGGEGKVAILEGIQSADNAQARKRGAEKAFNEAAGIEIVASQTANWGAEEALDVFTNMLQANPEIIGLFCANDMMSFGAIQAIDAAGKTGEITVASIDAEDQALKNVQEGVALATVYQNQDAQAAKAIELAIELINGNEIPKDVRVDTILMTKDDIK